MDLPITPSPLSGALSGPDRTAMLRRRAEEMETLFLSEMLSYAGLDENEGTFSGGVGEAQFASFLREEQAKGMVKAGGIGLAEQIFQSLVKKDGQ